MDPDATTEVAGVEYLAGDEATLVWELSVAVDHTFAVSTGSYDIAVHNEDAPFDPDDPYTWPDHPFDRNDGDDTVKGYRTLWNELSADRKIELRDELYADLRNHPDFGERLPTDGSPWPSRNIELQAEVWNKMRVGQLRVAMMDSAPGGLRGTMDNFLRGSSPEIGKHEWIPVSRAVGAKSKGVTAETIRSFVTPTLDTTGIRIIRDSDGIEIGREPFAHNGENRIELHEPLYELWDDPDLTAQDAIRRTQDFLDNDFILNADARADLDTRIPDLTNAVPACRG